jgi:ribosome-binding factor A
MPGSTASQRSARVAAQLRQELARQVSRELGDPRLEGLIVASVSMTPDLRLARVFWRLAGSSLPGADLEEMKKGATTALEKAQGRLRRVITARLGLRFAPELRFQYDEGQEARDRIDQLLHEVKTDEEKAARKSAKKRVGAAKEPKVKGQ